MLGGWAAQESDRYIRVLKSCIARIQQQVSSTTFADSSSRDPLCEKEALQDFAIFLNTHVSEEECSRCLEILGQRTYVSVPRETELPVEEQGPEIMQFPSEQLEQEDDDYEERVVAKAEARRKQQAWNVERTEKLGAEPRGVRRKLRESMDQGFYVAVSSKKQVRTLHLLGACYMIPTMDYNVCTFQGTRMPSRRLFDQVCKWCAKSGQVQQKDGGSSDCGTNTSSSSEDGNEPLE